MSYTFTLDQQNEISRLVALAEAIPMHERTYTDVYQYIADVLFEKNIEVSLGSGGSYFVSLADQDPVIYETALWFAGAAQVNAYEGFFSVLINEYTIKQLELRDPSWSTLTPDVQALKIKLASNQVAFNAIDNLVNEDPRWQVPTLTEIANEDAIGTGEILFSSSQFEGDSAYYTNQNSAWSGALLFSMIDSDDTPSSEQTNRLLGGDGELNTIEDFRDVLFAYASFVHAIEKVKDSIDFFTFNPIEGADDVTVALDTWWNDKFFANPLDAESVLDNMTNGDVGGGAIDYIRAFSVEGLFEKITALFGVESNSSIDIVQQMQEFFTQLSNNDQLSLTFKPLEELTSAELVALANDSDVGLAYRYALVNLNPFAITGNNDLYSSHNEQGELALENFSDQYLTDRARLLSLKNHLASNDISEDSSYLPGYYYDLSSGLEIDNGTGNHYQFGSDESGEFLSGSSNIDHLYAGAGNDFLRGFAGDDYFEQNM